MSQIQYTSEWYERFKAGIQRSAGVIVPLVLELLEPRSVCDVGCGRGTWLSIFGEHGISDLFGIDGDYVRRNELEFPAEQFLAADLRDGVPVDRRFDLAVCLEVAEHLPEDAAAGLVDALVRLAPAVLFSAAIPGQGGRGHINEQWPDYWEAHFGRGGYVAVDCIRPRIWNTRRVQFWYSQNTLLFVEKASLDSRPQLKREYERCEHPLPLVHPRMLEGAAKRPWISLKLKKDDRDAGLISQEEFEAHITRWVSEL